METVEETVEDYADDESESNNIPIKKKRGRKPKNPTEVKECVKEKKKRGRKPKVLDPDEISDIPRVRKRGRRPKCPVKSISEIRDKFKNIDDKIVIDDCRDIINENHSQTHVPFGNLNIIVHKPPEIDTSELRKFYNTNKELKPLVCKPLVCKPEIEYNSPFHSESESEVERKHISYCPKCTLNEKEELVKIEKKKVNKQLYKFSKQLDECGKWSNISNILCWWCCHHFTTIPIPAVANYEERRNRFSLKGIFCSWECSQAYTSKNCRNMSNLYKLYKEWTGERVMKIISAPSPFILKAFGGYMDITEYRKSHYTNRKIFLSENSVMSYINQDILEVYTEMEKKKKKKLNISRRKPLKTTETLFENMILS